MLDYIENNDLDNLGKLLDYLADLKSPNDWHGLMYARIKENYIEKEEDFS
jgi:hypothetical protein